MSNTPLEKYTNHMLVSNTSASTNLVSHITSWRYKNHSLLSKKQNKKPTRYTNRNYIIYYTTRHTNHLLVSNTPASSVTQHKPKVAYINHPKIQASLSSPFLLTLPDLVTPQKGNQSVLCVSDYQNSSLSIACNLFWPIFFVCRCL